MLCHPVLRVYLVDQLSYSNYGTEKKFLLQQRQFLLTYTTSPSRAWLRLNAFLLLACLLACLLFFACLPTCLPACLPACLFACLLACLLACILACILACMLACMLACLLACRSRKIIINRERHFCYPKNAIASIFLGLDLIDPGPWSTFHHLYSPK